ncbi:fluoride efflux transporter CrcB [Aquicella lusitana]|uniref:Fluoride-specific ion channel FluC n=1 Tax=Aquicella lusitana TaxID=254246 RepID=A0A370GS49_9COXI|nr:fluoride efflux transporter CrcB [Aquicella lusitana]RDI46522.1 camphor resistance protein CrcB [Aquicella lusitana]VVC74186.1 Putative fluoride ion transporter CrcB [Aquicella lusitana]
MQNLLIAGLGGFIGTMMRYLLNNAIYKILNYPLYPYGTMTINITGCFFIGLIASLAESRITLTPEVRTFIQIGILGGFTTFSTFGYETFTLMRDGQFILCVTNILTQVLLGLVGVWLGYQLGQ